MVGIEAGRAPGGQCGVARVGGAADRVFSAPWRRAGAPRRVAGRQGRQRRRVRVAAGGADHPVAREEAMIVAGVGCRREISADEIERVVRLALGMFQLPAERLDAIATESDKADDPAFPEAARRLSVKLMGCTVDDLDRVAGAVLTPSKLVLETKGVPSIAEASALVAAGRNGRLLGARVATASATCAIAIGDGR